MRGAVRVAREGQANLQKGDERGRRAWGGGGRCTDRAFQSREDPLRRSSRKHPPVAHGARTRDRPISKSIGLRSYSWAVATPSCHLADGLPRAGWHSGRSGSTPSISHSYHRDQSITTAADRLPPRYPGPQQLVSGHKRCRGPHLATDPAGNVSPATPWRTRRVRQSRGACYTSRRTLARLAQDHNNEALVNCPSMVTVAPLTRSEDIPSPDEVPDPCLIGFRTCIGAGTTAAPVESQQATPPFHSSAEQTNKPFAAHTLYMSVDIMRYAPPSRRDRSRRRDTRMAGLLLMRPRFRRGATRPHLDCPPVRKQPSALAGMALLPTARPCNERMMEILISALRCPAAMMSRCTTSYRARNLQDVVGRDGMRTCGI